MADLGTLEFGIHLKDYTDAEADKIKKKLENLSVNLTIDGKNVNISHTDLIKQQIEGAIKSVSVQSVRIDANSVKTQVENAIKGSSPQINVTVLKSALSNDLQTYLNNKTFTVGITITKGNAQNAVSTAFANISVPVSVTITSSAAIQQLRQSLANSKFKVGIEAKNTKDLINDIEAKLRGKNIKVGVTADSTTLVNSVKQSLQGNVIKAFVNVSVDAQAITRAVQSAINNAHFTYNPNGRGGNARNAANAQRNLANAYRQSAKGAYESARASVSLGRSLSTNIRLAGELGTSLGNLASVFGLKDLLRNMVLVGGQLENQRIALGAILQDGGKATEMFSKIQSLAVKSPFGIMDLNQYTKQLAAYSIPYNELYDTMKRLADISAGVGVDMGRIILAFGQVRAAGFLKGTELRQFTEANIPMVDKLAERFSILEKRIVSAGEVYDMISKKKITFEDVKAVLWDLTDEGGMFSGMQEVLSESLASKWKNLSDAIDVMYGKMADGWIGSGLKTMAEWLTELTKNWEYLATAIATASSSYAIYKGVVALGGRGEVMSLYQTTVAMKKKEAAGLGMIGMYRNLTKAERQFIATSDRLVIADIKRLARQGLLNKDIALQIINMGKLDAATEAYIARLYRLDAAQLQAAKSAGWWSRAKNTALIGIKGIGTALKGLFLNPWTWVFTGIALLGELAMKWKMNKDELKGYTDEIKESASGSMQAIGRELDKLKNIEIGKLNDAEIKTQIEDLATLIKDEAPYWQGILAEVFKKDADGNFVRTAKEQLEELIRKIKDVQDAKQMLADNPETFSKAIDATNGLFDESLTKNIEDYSKELQNAEEPLKSLRSYYKDVQTAIDNATGSNKEFLKASEGKSIQEKVKLLSSYTEEFKNFIDELQKTSPMAASLINKYINLVADKSSWDSWDNVKDDTKLFSDKVWDVLLNHDYNLSNLDEVAKQFIYDFGNRLVTNAKNASPAAIGDFWSAYLDQFNLEPEFSVVPENAYKNDEPYNTDKKDAVAEMWKKRVAEIEKAVQMYDKWKKVEGKMFAENRVKYNEELASLFNGDYGFNLDLEDPTEAYEYIQSLLDKSKEKQKELQLQIDVKISDANHKDAQDSVKKYLDEMKEYAKKTVSQWDLYKQLFEATGNKKFAMTAFEDTQVWDNAARNLKTKLEDEMEKQGRVVELDFTISDAEAKEVFEGKDGLYELWKEIKNRIEKNGIDLKINAGNAIKDTQSVAEKIKSLESQRDEELSQMDFEFGSDSEQYKAAAKKWENQIIALKGELFELSPAFKDLFVDTTGMASGKLYELWEKAKDLVDLIRQNTIQTVKNADGETIGRYYIDAKGNEQYVSEESLKSVDGQVSKLTPKVSQTQVAFKRLWEAIKGEDSNGDAKGKGHDFATIAMDIAVLAEATAQASEELASMFDALGNEGLADAFSFAGEMLNGVSTLGKAAASFASGDILGGIYGSISGITGIIGSIAGAHDKKLDKAIKKSQLEVKKLENAYKNLQTTIERQLSGVTNEQADKMLDSLIMQKYELSKQYQAEDEKKKTDESKLEDYKQQMAELQDQITHFYEDLANEQYGVDIKGWAGQIADALTEAFASGEDAAIAFDKTVSEILQGLMKEMISMEVIMPAMESLKNYMFGSKGIFTKNSDGGIDLTSSEATGLATELGKLKETIGSAEEIWNAVNDATGGLLESTEGASSGLSKEIKGVTEDTANLIGGYLNSIRADVAFKRSLIEKLIGEDVPKMNLLAEAQLQQLNMIQQNTKRNADAADRIYDLVNRVIDKGSNKLKV